MTPARATAKLGSQPTLFVPKNLGAILKRAGTVSLIDVIILKKYQIFFNQYEVKK